MKKIKCGRRFNIPHTKYNDGISIFIYTNCARIIVNSGFTRGQRGSGKRHRQRRQRGVYMSGTTVCAAVSATQMGVNFRQFSGTVSLWADAACTIFPSGVTNQNRNLYTLVKFPLPALKSRANSVERQFWICVVIGCRLPDTNEIAHAGSALCRWITRSWRPLDGHFERFLAGNRTVAARVNSTEMLIVRKGDVRLIKLFQ